MAYANRTDRKRPRYIERKIGFGAKRDVGIREVGDPFGARTKSREAITDAACAQFQAVLGGRTRDDANDIKLVAAKAGFRSNLIRWTQVNGKATELEGMLLEMGKNPGYDGIDGATEFRALTDLELEAAVDTIDFCAAREQ